MDKKIKVTVCVVKEYQMAFQDKVCIQNIHANARPPRSAFESCFFLFDTLIGQCDTNSVSH